jgi:hypothetical protein
MKIQVLAAVALALLATSCATEGGYDTAAKAARDAAIRAEPRGDYFIGRRYHTNGCRFWGYVRRPGQLWEDAKLVVMSERLAKQPDRLPEAPESGNGHGYDHNSEYRIWGSFTGSRIYDPNADLEVEAFLCTKFQLANRSPGFLFLPGERYDPRYLPAREEKNR